MTDLAIIMWQGAFARFNRKRQEEGGATVLEWALIAAVVVVAASIVAAVILKIVNKKSGDLESCANQPVGSKCGG
jgi:Flp pilus assembly pilin Flp